MNVSYLALRSPDGSWLVEGDDRSLTSNSLDQYQYFIMLADDKMEKRGENDECITAAVCQSKTDKRFFRNIGFQSEKNYYIEGLWKLLLGKIFVFIRMKSGVRGRVRGGGGG